VSVSSQMTVVSLSEHVDDIDASVVEAKCPLCRTQSRASFNPDLAEQLETQYPRTYEERRTEEQSLTTERGGSVETLTLYIGNKHKFDRLAEGSTPNAHHWTFFVKPSRADLVQEVHIILVGVDFRGAHDPNFDFSNSLHISQQNQSVLISCSILLFANRT